MKKKISKDLIVFIILIPICLYGAFFIGSRSESTLPWYSIRNKSKYGYSVLYDAMKKLKLPVDLSLSSLEDNNPKSIQIVVPNDKFSITSDEVEKWVKEGGVLVYPVQSPDMFFIFDAKPVDKGNLKLYTLGEGNIIVVDGSKLTNKALIKDTSFAYDLVSELYNYGAKKIYFNESAMYGAGSNQGLWDALPMGYKFLVYQFALVIVAYFYYKGKGFGKKIPLYEEAERNENEYLYSTAYLFRQAKCFDIILENYYRSFLKELNSREEDWLSYYESCGYEGLNKAKRVYEFMNSDKKAKEKELLQIITLIEDLNNILKKRRDSFWKGRTK